jgi:hypothetical protein
MTQQTTNLSISDDSRCAHRFANGRRCRLSAATANAGFCLIHAPVGIRAHDDFSVLPTLVRKPEDFQSAENLNQSLAALHNLLAEGRISPRRASVIAYVDSLILRSITAMQLEEQRAPVEIIYDAPRPWREPPPCTEEPLSPTTPPQPHSSPRP